jgi:hypothetical protein
MVVRRCLYQTLMAPMIFEVSPDLLFIIDVTYVFKIGPGV